MLRIKQLLDLEVKFNCLPKLITIYIYVKNMLILTNLTWIYNSLNRIPINYYYNYNKINTRYSDVYGLHFRRTFGP